MSTTAKLMLLVISIMITSNACRTHAEPTKNTIKCIVKGEVINPPKGSTLYLTKEGDKLLINSEIIKITNNTFEFTIEGEYEEPYKLMFQNKQTGERSGSIIFFTENTTLQMQLYPETEKNIIEGGKITNAYYDNQHLYNKIYKQCYHIHQTYILENYPDINRNDYRPDTDFILSGNTPDPRAIDTDKEIVLLFEKNEYDSEVVKELQQKIWAAQETGDDEKERAYKVEISTLQKEGKHLSSKALELERIASIINNFIGNWQLGYMEENVSLVTLLDLIQWMELSLSTYPIFYEAYGKTHLYIELFRNKYEKEFPGHPLTQRMNMLINSHMTIKPGGKYIDFTAPDFQGNEFTLSSQIEEKIALINLWSSWCGPCRKKAINMIPVYEEFKEKGFTIVGIAREKRIEGGLWAVTQDKYPWLNLVELNDKGKIWYQYGIENKSGCVLLVDTDGTILSVNPTVEEVKKILNEKLN